MQDEIKNRKNKIAEFISNYHNYQFVIQIKPALCQDLPQNSCNQPELKMHHSVEVPQQLLHSPRGKFSSSGSLEANVKLQETYSTENARNPPIKCVLITLTCKGNPLERPCPNLFRICASRTIKFQLLKTSMSRKRMKEHEQLIRIRNRTMMKAEVLSSKGSSWNKI